MREQRRAADTNYWTATGVIPRWQLLAVYVLVVAAGFVGFLSIRSAVNHANTVARENHRLALRASSQAAQTKRLADKIQAQRKDLCADQNARHKRTIQTLNSILAEFVKKHPDQAKQVRDSVRSNVLLINALAPKRQCSTLQPNHP